MNTIPLISLLRRNESETLDFKRELVAFSTASDEQKSELLKDILAMANAWKDSDAYIVGGAEEEGGRVSKVCGANGAINDADVQQYVNSNTNRPVSFRIVETQYEGATLKIIQIDRDQNRPICLKKDIGKLKKDVVYIRRGSSTAIASPDEIAEMGRDDRQHRSERVDYYWARFRVFLSDVEQKVNYLHDSRGIIYESTLAENRLPLDEVKNLLKEAGDLGLEISFYANLKKLTDKIRIVDEYMNLGADKINKMGSNFFYEIQSLRFDYIRKMKDEYHIAPLQGFQFAAGADNWNCRLIV